MRDSGLTLAKIVSPCNSSMSDLPTWKHRFAGQNQRVCRIFSFLQDTLASDLHGPLKRAKIVLSLLPVSVNHKTSPHLL